MKLHFLTLRNETSFSYLSPGSCGVEFSPGNAEVGRGGLNQRRKNVRNKTPHSASSQLLRFLHDLRRSVSPCFSLPVTMVQGPLTGSSVCPVVVQSLLVLPTFVSSRPSRRDLVLNKGQGSRVSEFQT